MTNVIRFNHLKIFADRNYVLKSFNKQSSAEPFTFFGNGGI